MLTILLNIQEFILKLTNSVGSILKVIILSDFTILGKLKINRTNNRINILGNGPSLIKDIENNKELFRNSDVLVVNYFANTELYERIKPKYYCISAPEMLEDNPNERVKKNSNELFNALALRTKWELNLFLIASAKKSSRWKKILSKNANINVIYYNNTPIEGFQRFNFIGWKYNFGLPRPHNVLVPSLVLSINLGYKFIYIMGADHSWLKELSVDENNRALLNQKHFYDKDTSYSKPMRKGYDEERKLHEILHKFYLTFKGYHEIKEYALKNNSVIYNLTEGSFIDAFERKIN